MRKSLLAVVVAVTGAAGLVTGAGPGQAADQPVPVSGPWFEFNRPASVLPLATVGVTPDAVIAVPSDVNAPLQVSRDGGRSFSARATAGVANLGPVGSLIVIPTGDHDALIVSADGYLEPHVTSADIDTSVTSPVTFTESSWVVRQATGTADSRLTGASADGVTHVISWGDKASWVYGQSRDKGATWTTRDWSFTPESSPGADISAGAVAPAIAADGANVAVGWTQLTPNAAAGNDDVAVWVQVSHDHGATWADPVRIYNRPAVAGWAYINRAGSPALFWRGDTVAASWAEVEPDTTFTSLLLSSSTDDGGTWSGPHTVVVDDPNDGAYNLDTSEVPTLGYSTAGYVLHANGQPLRVSDDLVHWRAAGLPSGVVLAAGSNIVAGLNERHATGAPVGDFSWGAIDDAAPVLTITGPPAYTRTFTTIALNLRVSDAGPTTIACTMDGVPRDCAAFGLKQGRHTFTVTARDRVGHVTTASHTWVLDQSAPALATAAASVTLGGRAGFSWRATDALSPIKGYRLRYRSGYWNKALSAWSSVIASTNTTWSAPITPGQTICVSVQAIDAVGNASPYSPARCTTSPLDDRSLNASSGWTRGINSNYYRGTYTTTARPSAWLTRNGMRANGGWLIATVCPGCGTVYVYDDNAYIGKISLASSTTRTRVALPLPWGMAPRYDTLGLKTTTGRRVTIDGLALRATP